MKKKVVGFKFSAALPVGLALFLLLPAALVGARFSAPPSSSPAYPDPTTTAPPVLTEAPTPTSSPIPLPTLRPTSIPLPTLIPRPDLVAWSFQPADDGGHTPADSRASLVLTFDLPISLSSLRASFSLTPSMPGEFTIIDERTAAFTPAQEWPFATRYDLRLNSPLWAGHVFFTTPNAVETSFGQREHPLSSQAILHLVFGYAMDRSSVEAGLRIEPPTPFQLVWVHDRAISLVPQDAWEIETTYTVTLDHEVQTAGGIPLGEVGPWNFAVRSGVVGHAPVGTATWFTPLEVSFDQPIDRDSVEAALTIDPPASGTFTWEEDRFRFAPTAGWQVGSRYTAILASSARAADGTPLLNAPLEWDFEIRSAADEISFGYGPNVQVLDAAGSRLIQFEREGEGSLVGLALYQLTAEQLLSDYSSAFKGEREVETAGLPLLRRWVEDAPQEQFALPADVEPGIYVLAVGGGGEEADALIVVLTHYTLVLKEAAVGRGTTAEHQVTGWVSEIASHQPRPGMAVRLYDRAGNLYAEATSDQAGRFETTVQGDTDPLLALGQVDGEWTVCGFGSEWQTRSRGYWEWWGWSPIPPTGQRYRVYIYTDRPIYRPGQTVYFRAVVREDDDALYTVPPLGTPVTVRLRDARDNVITTQELTTGEFGSLNAHFNLAEGGTLGVYHVEVELEGEVTRQALKVEAYRTPDYEVIVHTDRNAYLEGDTITVTVEARYYLGQPVAEVPVSLAVYKQSSGGWECSRWGEECWVRLQNTPHAGTTDAQGRWVTVLSAEQVVEESWWSRQFSILSVEATVDDGSGQSVSSNRVVEVHQYPHWAEISLQRNHFASGVEFPVAVRIYDYLGDPAGGVAAVVGVYRGSSGSDARQALARSEGASGEDGWFRTTLQVERQGWYRLGVHGAGLPLRDTWIWVYDADDIAAWRGTPDELFVSADRDSYAVGDVAQLLVRSPVTGTALLTLERGQVRRMEVIELAGLVTRITVPITADLAPNVHATVQIYQPLDPTDVEGRRWYSVPDASLLIASTELVVPVPERRLQVAIRPERDTYGPREEAVVEIQVRDAAGQPVRAELSLAVVDEAIYALSQDLTVDPFEAFYFERDNLVRTYDGLRPTRVLARGGGRGDGGGGVSVESPRRYFPDTAYWNPAIVTDAAGRAVVSVPLPDSLTRWRLVARAVTLDTDVGEGTAALTVTQSLVVRPALPRFLVQGDVLSVTATVHNYAAAVFAGEAGLLLEGLALHSPLTYSLSVASGETARVAWDVEATSLGTVTVTTYARSPDEVDAVQYALPVVPYAVPEVTSFAGELVGERIERFYLSERFIPEVTEVQIRLAPSEMPALLEGLQYLTGYPFG